MIPGRRQALAGLLKSTKLPAMEPLQVRCGKRTLSLQEPQIMGVINMTPDSFSDGARYLQHGRWDLGLVTEVALAMHEAGAAILDVGGESTRPGAAQVSAAEELARVMPVIETLVALDLLVSVDTSKPAVAQAALAAGAGLLNDVQALQAPGMLAVAAASDAAICLMHMQGEPRTMQQAPQYQHVVTEVRDFLARRVQACVAAGIAPERLLLDPGFGFGKTLAHNLELLRGLRALTALQLPLLVGMSRKSMLGAITGRDVQERQAAGVAAALLAVQQGARIIRTHDVAATRDAIRVWQAVQQPAQPTQD